MSNKSGIAEQIISLPKGGGALRGLGEKFSPDLHTGTGNFTIPISIPRGRIGFQPDLSLVYSSGHGNGYFGLGWSLSIPSVSRRTSKGVPRYGANDTFVVSAAEDLVHVGTQTKSLGGRRETREQYRPRTEGLFARIERVIAYEAEDLRDDYWEVCSKDGLTSVYGTPGSAPDDAAVLADPANPENIFGWRLTETRDPFGYCIKYAYGRDKGKIPPHHWDQPRLDRIDYVDYGEDEFLVSVEFEYELRDDTFSDHRAGFEVRTSERCKAIVVRTHADRTWLMRSYQLRYERDVWNGVSLLQSLQVVGYDENDAAVEELPPLEFSYTQLQPEARKFCALQGVDLPGQSLARQEVELADLFGNGLPDIIEMNGVSRYWRNLGSNRFDVPRWMPDMPGGLALSDPGIQLIDANGDGRLDLLVTREGLSGYFSLQPDGLWDPRSFQPYRYAPSFSLEDPAVRLVDLDGDGVTDAVRSGTRLECFFSDPREGWRSDRTRWVERRSVEDFPNVDFSDPRVRLADMTGDGLQDIVLIHDGDVEYWPSLGHGDWGARISMQQSPRFPYGYDPKHVLLGDVDGDGLADIVFVDDGEVMLWLNQSGNSWSAPIVVKGTPPVTDIDAVRLADMLGSGISGVLWSADKRDAADTNLFFLDFTGGIKPYLLSEMDNHTGAVTRVEYAPSTHFYLEDEKSPTTRWPTSLPFPVQVVARVNVIDELSKGKLTTEYRYHDGYWDGADREFRGFGMVEQIDTETFDAYNRSALHGDEAELARFEPGLDRRRFAPPLLTKTWFHQGPIGPEFGDWQEPDYEAEYWPGDPSVLEPAPLMQVFLAQLPRRVRRDAVRALRGNVLRTELYALDGSDRQERPYTVTESLFGVCEVRPGYGEPLPTQEPQTEDSGGEADHDGPQRIFFPHLLAQRMTQWERGDDPLTNFSFNSYTNSGGDFDAYGRLLRQTTVACPRGWRGLSERSNAYLATLSLTEYARPLDPGRYIHDRVAKTSTYEVTNKTDASTSSNDASRTVFEVRDIAEGHAALRIVTQTLNFYDGDAQTGLGFGQVGNYGALVRSESLVLSEAALAAAYPEPDALVDSGLKPPYLATAGLPDWPAEFPEGFSQFYPTGVHSNPTRPGLAITPLGYGFADGSGEYARGYFTAVQRTSYGFHSDPDGWERGLVTEQIDPLGNQTKVAYDAYRLLPVEVSQIVEPALSAPANALTMLAEYDYRVLQPKVAIDPNGNCTEFVFSASGLLKEIWLRGNPAKDEGDRERASTIIDYDLRAFERSKAEDPTQPRPVFTRSIRRRHHDRELDVSLPQRDETLETREYFDGFGRLLQTRTQGEEERFGDAVFGGGDGVLPERPADSLSIEVAGLRNVDADRPNVVVSGWQIYDNKGRKVEKYEPFFAEGWEFAPATESQRRLKTTLIYDARGRVVRTLNPNRSEQRAVYGVPVDLAEPEDFEPTPWEAFTYDANDNGGRTLVEHPDARGYEHHWDTPASAQVDALGRTVVTVERNRAKRAQAAAPLPPLEEYQTVSTYDIQGNLLALTDALGRTAFEYVYDLAGRPLRVMSIDAGTRCSVLDAAGNLIEQRDSKGALALQAYDATTRVTHLWAKDGRDQTLTLRERLVYGYSAAAGLSRTDAETANLLGKLYQHYDEAGLVTFVSYDFKGNPLERQRRVIADSEILKVFDTAETNGWAVAAFRVDWQTPATVALADPTDSLLDSKVYSTSLTYDALNRLKTMLYPEDSGQSAPPVAPSRKLLRPVYNRGGALESVQLDGDIYVERIAYNAKGQRVLIAYGNDLMTRYAYDDTFSLVRLRTERYSKPDPLTYVREGGLLQDITYQYDLAGNVLAIEDRAPGSGLPSRPNRLDRSFTYDPLYRLLTASGREFNPLPSDPPWADTPRGSDVTRTRRYDQTYVYDATGNLTSLHHQSTPGAFNRVFASTPGTNRLASATDTGASRSYAYDETGNLTEEDSSRHFEWDYADRLKAFRVQTAASEPSVHVHYLYDGSGQRVKKLTRKQNGAAVEVTVYVDGVFEHHLLLSRSNGSYAVEQENNTLHVMDDQRRIAEARIGDAFPDDGAPGMPVRYHLGDHLGSSSVTVGGTTASSRASINREEYYPYGETSFGSFARKRYRFTGKERDEASGLYYHGARYYAPWLSRWLSCDPAESKDTSNVYAYVHGDPLGLFDPDGRQEEVAQEEPKPRNPITEEQLHNARMEFLKGVGAAVGEDRLSALKDHILGPLGPLGPWPASVSTLADNLGAELPSISTDLGSYDRTPSGASSWNVLESALIEGDVSNTFAGEGFNFLSKGKTEEANQAFGNAGYRYGKAAVSSVALGTIVAGAAQAGGAVVKTAKTYIVYVFQDLKGAILYVGRASGQGSPLKILWQRISKGHDVAKANPHLEPRIISEQSSALSNKGAEAVFHENALDSAQKGGYQLLNSSKAPPASWLKAKVARTLEKIAAFSSDKIK